MPELPAVHGALDTLTQLPRGITALAGAVVLVRGARLYPLVIAAPGLALGVALGLALPLEPSQRAIAAVVLAALGALACRFLERVAIWGIGAVLSGTIALWAWPLFRTEPPPSWLAAVGAVVGLLLFPAVFRAALKPVTAALGAMLLVWSLGWQHRPLLGVALFAVGLVVQIAADRKDKGEDD